MQTAQYEQRTGATPRSLERRTASRGTMRRLRDLSALALRRVTESSVPRLERVLEELLAELGHCVDADRATIFEITDDRLGPRVLAAWSAPGVPRLPLARLHDVPALPIRLGGSVVGGLSLGGELRAKPWSTAFVEALEPLAHVVGLALGRRAAHHRLVEAQEQERARLAREIHDDLGQRLAALKLHLDLMQRDPGVGPQVVERLSMLSTSAAEVAAVVRGLGHALHPGVLERLGLRGALEALCAQQRSAGGVQVRMQPAVARAEPVVRTGEAALGLYRVAQEALANAIRHGQAQRIDVGLEIHGNVARLSVHDDGVGMVLRGGASSSGLGLSNMRERMHLVGGTLRIDSTPGHGTTVEATVPWPEPEPSS